MTILSAQSIAHRCFRSSMIEPFSDREVFEGMSYGLGHAGYDIRIAQDVDVLPYGFALASSIEKFELPNDLLMSIRDKSTWARRRLSVFNTVAEPGWKGYLTLELVNHGFRTIRIKAGSPIAQCIFELLDQPTVRPYGGKYQNQKFGPQGPLEERPETTALIQEPDKIFGGKTDIMVLRVDEDQL